MGKIKFAKLIASGNDFVVIRLSGYPVIRLKKLAKKVCDRKYGIGADGLLVLEKSKRADVKMRIFNADGSEAEMCGNGARCVALFKAQGTRHKAQLNLETKAGIIESEVNKDNVKIRLTDPKDIKLNFPITINNRRMMVNYINTGVPHVVIFTDSLNKINVKSIGEAIRFHKKFSPRGTNVNFIQPLGRDSIGIRTYERGVEDETLACGTGTVAAALILATLYSLSATRKVNVLTKSGEVLKVHFNKVKHKIKDVWLEGKAKLVYEGCWCDYK